MNAEIHNDVLFSTGLLETIARELEIKFPNPEDSFCYSIGRLFLLQEGVAEFVKRSLPHLPYLPHLGTDNIRSHLIFAQAAFTITQAATEAYEIPGHSEIQVHSGGIELCKQEIVRSAQIAMGTRDEGRIIDHIFTELTTRQPSLKNYLIGVMAKLPDQKIAPSVILSLYAIYVACCERFDKDRRARFQGGARAGTSFI
jgi:hypothetical protein